MQSGANISTDTQDLKKRLCRSLVADVLREVEDQLIEVKSIRFLAECPWVPGKRLRPITFLLSYLSVEVEKTLNPRLDGRESKLAAAIELMHEASLVHDDLVDRSMVRRGKPTMQVVNGDGLALLIGDYMVFRGLKLVLDAAQTQSDIVLARELANTGLAIAHGEVDQLDAYLNHRSVEDRMSIDAYVQTIGKKTAAFFAGCAEGGAALAGADRVLRDVYRSFGMNMGLVFQMVDDLMDVIGISDKAQKTLKSNLSEGTVTLPMIHAYTLHPNHEGLRKLAQAEKLSRAERSSLHRLLATREVIELCRATMDEYAAKATESLKQMPANIYRAGLQDLFDYVRQCSWGGLDEKLAVGDASKLHA
jgi:geranylgeranyl pyrophosphate synthase